MGDADLPTTAQEMPGTCRGRGWHAWPPATEQALNTTIICPDCYISRARFSDGKVVYVIPPGVDVTEPETYRTKTAAQTAEEWQDRAAELYRDADHQANVTKALMRARADQLKECARDLLANRDPGELP